MRKTIHFQHYCAPCGEITLASIGDELCLCDWRESPRAERNRCRLIRHLDAALTEATSEVLESAKRQLDEYFAGVRKTFDLKTHPVGTAFQQQVWRALCEIPYGETRTYQDIALSLNNPQGARAVAQAIGANGISIIIPCHRVIGSDHSLTGFAADWMPKDNCLRQNGAADFSPSRSSRQKPIFQPSSQRCGPQTYELHLFCLPL